MCVGGGVRVRETLREGEREREKQKERERERERDRERERVLDYVGVLEDGIHYLSVKTSPLYEWGIYLP